jgi:UDP-3-O-[3-hydroxymyristoyl] glucosamine N-acyltransferase
MPTYNIGEIAALINGEANCQSSVVVNNIASLSLAQPKDLACFSNLSQLPFLNSSRAGIILTTPALASYCHQP